MVQMTLTSVTVCELVPVADILPVFLAGAYTDTIEGPLLETKNRVVCNTTRPVHARANACVHFFFFIIIYIFFSPSLCTDSCRMEKVVDDEILRFFWP